MDLAEDEEEELVRYGYWSCEAQDLHLPSYRSAFLFLSRIPLEVIHEFLRMRLEQKPEEPSVLCIRQVCPRCCIIQFLPQKFANW